MDPMLWVVGAVLLIIYGAIDYPIYTQCRAHGFGAYYCFMQMK